MAWQAVPGRGLGNSSKTDGATFDLIGAYSLDAGQTKVVCLTCDTAGAATPTISSIAKPAGETSSWSVVSAVGPNSGAGTSVVVFIAVITATVNWTGVEDLTVTFSDSITAKAGIWQDFSGGSSTRRGSAANNTQADTSPSVSLFSSAQPQAGDLAVVCCGQEHTDVMSGDADTTNGSWVTPGNNPRNTSGGGAASNVSMIAQYKIVTAAGEQQWSTTSATTDRAVIAVTLAPGSSGTPVAQVSQVNTAQVHTRNKRKTLGQARR